MALAELLRKAEAEPGLDVLRTGVRVLAGALLAGQRDEWQVGRRDFSAESMALLQQDAEPPVAPATDEPRGGAAAPPRGEDRVSLPT
ncbi:MAG: hypothetical protein IT335_14690 [Thermomicrobiales bacterium]|nr:hypothetical protein [Thermomicrobiales bacterium]